MLLGLRGMVGGAQARQLGYQEAGLLHAAQSAPAVLACVGRGKGCMRVQE